MKLAPLIIGMVVLPGCTVGPNYVRPDAPLSGQWRSAPAVAQTDAPWWQAFGDPILDGLEAEAMQSNLGLEQALARIDQARGGYQRAEAALLPSAEVDGGYARTHQSLNSGLGELARKIPSFPRTVNTDQVTLSANWEIDFAGGLRRQRESAEADLAARVAAADAQRLATSVEIADAYWSLRGTQVQARALKDLIELQAAQLEFSVAHVIAGDAAATSSDRAAAALASLRAQAPALDGLIEAQKNRIAVLLGRDPSVEIAQLATFQSVKDSPDPFAGTPADILRRRPDVRVAESRLVSANAGIGAALAEYYPRVSLSALAGQVSGHLQTFGSSDSTIAQGAVGLRWRLFDFARIDADVQLARGQTREARAAYRQAVLSAAESVETSFAQLASARSRLQWVISQRDIYVRVRNSDELAMRIGQISREEFVSDQQAVVRSDLDLAIARTDVARATINCHQALGSSTAIPTVQGS